MLAMSTIRRAATLILTRGPDSAPEVYLVKRADALKFFGGYWVFPGGNLSEVDYHQEDDPEALALKRCAVREALEETDVLSATLGGAYTPERKQALKKQIQETPAQWQSFLDGFELDLLRPVFRITTPSFIPVRFDTQFMHARACDNETPAVDNYELVEGLFIKPRRAIDAWERGELDIAPPVLFLLRLMADSTDLDAFFAHAEAATARLQQGALHSVYFSPGIFMAPLPTPTLPPATTTNTLIAGADHLYVVDPATPDKAQQQRLFDKMDELLAEGKTFEAVLLTHHHSDHVGALNAVSQRYQLPVRAHEAAYERVPPGYLRGQPLRDGDRLPLGTAPDGTKDWHLAVLHTPGHAVDHLCFIDSRYHAAIVGDMLSTVSTIIINPPEGHLGTYLRSLNRLLDTPMKTLFPAHGPASRDGHALVRRFLKHREKRENAVKRALGNEPQALDELVPRVYPELPEATRPIAARSLLANLIKLEEDGFSKQEAGGWALA